MSKKLAGKVAVVTGASKGIGASIAQALAEEGASVVVNYSSSKPDAERVVVEIGARGAPRSPCRPMYRSPRTSSASSRTRRGHSAASISSSTMRAHTSSRRSKG